MHEVKYFKENYLQYAKIFQIRGHFKIARFIYPFPFKEHLGKKLQARKHLFLKYNKGLFGFRRRITDYIGVFRVDFYDINPKQSGLFRNQERNR